ncbi:hypothetical protein ACFFX0_13675 [Citricoccus parietis]|uniref:Uncharacterized protein n=1 Tax=Citricoccus parietis TaxID=592307 RepID=A0ABV5FZS8_9MICC
MHGAGPHLHGEHELHPESHPSPTSDRGLRLALVRIPRRIVEPSGHRPAWLRTTRTPASSTDRRRSAHGHPRLLVEGITACRRVRRQAEVCRRQQLLGARRRSGDPGREAEI